MTDTTHEAPERIWADGNAEWNSGSWGLDKEFDHDVEYVRADLVQEAEQRGYANAMEAERKLHETRIEELEAERDALAEKLAKALEALGLADAALSGANMNMRVVERKVKAAIREGGE